MTFVLSKVLWLLVKPSHVILILLVLGLLLALTRWRRLGLIFIGISTVALIIVAVLPVAYWLAAPLENRFPAPRELPSEIDGIVVLGGAVDLPISRTRRQVSLNDAAERLTTFITLARRYPSARLVFAGGSGGLSMGDLREADVARQLMADLGLGPERVRFERNSRNTYENAVLAKKLAQPAAGEAWLLITSAAHMPRSIGVFRKVGWTVTPYPIDYKTKPTAPSFIRPYLNVSLSTVDKMTREWLGLLAYRVMGRTDRVFPGPPAVARTETE